MFLALQTNKKYCILLHQYEKSVSVILFVLRFYFNNFIFSYMFDVLFFLAPGNGALSNFEK